MLYHFRKKASQSRKKRYEWRKRAASAQLGKYVEMMQMRADLEISLTRGSFALPLPALVALLRCIAHVCCIVQTRVRPKFNFHCR